MRARLRLSLSLTAGLLACSDGPDEPDFFVEVRAACEQLCTARTDCGEAPPEGIDCEDACVADVGTPGPTCAEAIERWATCVADHCGDEAACAKTVSARDAVCGGTG
jgi:hypothetical protein